MPVEELATPGQLRVWLDLDENDEAAIPTGRAQLLLDGVAGAVLDYCNRTTFGVIEDETIVVDGNGGRELVLPRAPLLDVTAAIEDPTGLHELVNLVPPDEGWTERIEWSADGIVRRVDGGRFVRRFRWYSFTVSHGYEEIPTAARNTVLRVAARAVSNPEGLATESAGGYNAGFAFDETRLPVLTAPDRRELDPFRL